MLVCIYGDPGDICLIVFTWYLVKFVCLNLRESQYNLFVFTRILVTFVCMCWDPGEHCLIVFLYVRGNMCLCVFTGIPVTFVCIFIEILRKAVCCYSRGSWFHLLVCIYGDPIQIVCLNLQGSWYTLFASMGISIALCVFTGVPIIFDPLYLRGFWLLFCFYLQGSW